MPSAQPNQSLIDGLECLAALATAREPVGSRELARQLGMEPTRANRLLKTLASLGIAQQTPTRQYVPGPGMHVLATQSLLGSGLIRHSLAPLESLRDLNLDVAMGVLWRDRVCYLYFASPGMPLALALGRVGLFPAVRSSIGLALLAREPLSHVRTLFPGEQVPDFAGKSFDALLTRLKKVQSTGYARVKQSESTTSLAVAIDNLPAAVALSGNLLAFDTSTLVRRLTDVASMIAAAQKPMS